jgi:hypothetical protein
MKTRCENSESKDFSLYGKLGVTICAAWSASFEVFLEDMGTRPDGTSIDRFPNRHGNYEPGNCRWATPKEQNRNKDNFIIIRSPQGIIPLIDYAGMVGLTRGAALMRLRRGKLKGCVQI